MPKHPILKQPTYPYKLWAVLTRFNGFAKVGEISVHDRIGEYVKYRTEGAAGMVHCSDTFNTKAEAIEKAIGYAERAVVAYTRLLAEANTHLAVLQAELKEADHA